jgi:hypothetical protein
MFVRMIAVSGLLCAAMFAASFALGRTERPGVASAESSAVSLPATAAGPAIPIALSSAPAIAIEAPVRARASLHASHPGLVVPSDTHPATTAPSVSIAPVSEAPAVTAPVAPVSQRKQSTAGGSSHGSGGTKSETSGGTSFDSSG